ncbi:MAG: phosphate ABC transporter substrate-binding protein [Oscillospiraceae bacterium]|nr:phosphate ABC transporter substrate-binding protein [Oscillospiraceae bacterium]
MRSKRLTILSAALIMLLSACGRENSASVIIAGSTSVHPYAELLAEEYYRLPHGMMVDVQGGGSSAGIMQVENGIADIGMSSRSLKENEQHLWQIEIAKDGLAIILHPSNSVDNLTKDQIRGIYAAEITNWSQVGGADKAIHIIAREDGSGTRSAFEELVMAGSRITPRAIIQSSNGAVRQLVSGNPSSIGFISLGMVDEGEKPVKAIAIEGAAATAENVANGSYGLFRSFLFVTKAEPEGSVKEFIDYVLSPDGQRHLLHEGLIGGAAG